MLKKILQFINGTDSKLQVGQTRIVESFVFTLELDGVRKWFGRYKREEEVQEYIVYEILRIARKRRYVPVRWID